MKQVAGFKHLLTQFSDPVNAARYLCDSSTFLDLRRIVHLSATMVKSRRRKGGSPGGESNAGRLVLTAIVAVFLFVMLIPTGAFSLADVGRGGSVGVSADSNAELGLGVFSCVEKNSRDPLVTVTNNFEEAFDATISLNDPSIGTLYANGMSGNSVTVSLAVGASTTVDIEASAGGPYPKSFAFTVTVAGDVTSATATRSSQVDKNCGGSGTPTPTPTATATPVPGNDPPVADFTYSRRGNGKKVDVDASASSDTDGTIVSYEWDVGADGTIDDTGQTATLDAPSGTQIKLIVTDNDGATDSVTKTVS